MDIGVQLCQQYGIETMMRPIIDYVPTSDSPPPAPKHIVNAPGTRAKRVKDDSHSADASNASSPASSVPKKTARQSAAANQRAASSKTRKTAASERQREVSMQPSPSVTPSADEEEEEEHPHKRRRQEHSQRSSQSSLPPPPPPPPPAAASAAPVYQYYQQQPPQVMPQYAGGPARYARLILDFFVSETQIIPDFLQRPPADFDANVVIDDDGHTALHWASAMGRLRVVQLLLAAGADVFRSNGVGQTPLMRAVMFTNSYDLRKFPELLQLLQRSTLNIDHQDRSLFHHIVELALHKGKTAAARYYLETALERIKELPGDTANVLNYHDDEGETCLTLAARAHSRSLVKLLIDAGADPLAKNMNGKSAQDYVLEDERLREAEQLPLCSSQASNGSNVIGQIRRIVQAAAASQGQGLYSNAARRIAMEGIPQLSELLSSMANTYETELVEREKDTAQATALLGNIHTDLQESQSTLGALRGSLEAQSPSLQQLKEQEKSLERQLKERMAQRFRAGWASYVAEEEKRRSQLDMSGQALPQHMQDLYQPVSTGTVDEALEVAHTEIQHLQQERQRLVDELIGSTGVTSAVPLTAHEEQNLTPESQERIGQYRRLLSLGTGLPTGEVEGEVDGLLENLEQALVGA